MKNLAILAVALGILSGAANAESAVNEAPVFTLALNSNPAVTWLEPATANNVVSNALEQEVAKTMEKISTALDKQLESKIAKEIEYAMQ
jgi:hypothetical protein